MWVVSQNHKLWLLLLRSQREVPWTWWLQITWLSSLVQTWCGQRVMRRWSHSVTSTPARCCLSHATTISSSNSLASFYCYSWFLLLSFNYKMYLYFCVRSVAKYLQPDESCHLYATLECTACIIRIYQFLLYINGIFIYLFSMMISYLWC